jgi:CubicO group peptidase (beta-lactamase class C family)/D-alanyl-D-alanine dipeptidase
MSEMRMPRVRLLWHCGSAKHSRILLVGSLLLFASSRGLVPQQPAQNPAPPAGNVPPDTEWSPVVALLRQSIQREMSDKQLPAVAIALVDDQRIVWSEGFGYQDAKHTTPASADTVFRVGSVSKLFTDIGVMQLVEAGKLDLDLPVETYLSNFKPNNPFGQPITLRELMSHRSGLVREPPVGNYFDATSPSLQKTVESLNQMTLVYAAGSKTKYSNAGLATVGYVLQTVSGEPYADYLQHAVLQPLGMTHSAFEQKPELMAHLASATMWSYDGLNFSAPTFQLGEGPAGCMYSTVGDLGRFLSVLFAGGRSGTTQVIHTRALNEMWKPQFSSSAPRNFGLGFQLGSLDGHRTISHSGAIYGFATQLTGLPDQKLGVVVITTVDSANAVADHIAYEALHLMLSHQKREPLLGLPSDKPIDPEMARRADGHYTDGKDEIDLTEESGRLFLSRPKGGRKIELKDAGDYWVQDGRLYYDPARIEFHENGADDAHEDSLEIQGATYRRQRSTIPQEATPAIKQLVGEYGWSFDKLYALEDRGRLKLLIEWFDFAELEQSSRDQFRFPASGLYDGENATFQRNAEGVLTGVRVGGVLFPKLPTNADGAIFQIKPLKPVAQLREEASTAKPPAEAGNFRPADLVELNKLDPSIKLDIRYATSRNFLGSPLYLQSRAYMQRPAAEAVVRASQALHKLGYGLLIHDSYRPWYVTKMFWNGTPDDKKIFVANPSEGSRHNRGCAVDLTLYDLKSGKPIVMTGGYDEMSERSYPYYPGGTSLERWHRHLLREAMEHEGFRVFEFEWWHFDYKDYHLYAISNLTFEQLDKAAR